MFKFEREKLEKPGEILLLFKENMEVTGCKVMYCTVVHCTRRVSSLMRKCSYVKSYNGNYGQKFLFSSSVYLLVFPGVVPLC
jgi:hypothetical protein